MVVEISVEPGFISAKAYGEFSLKDAQSTYLEVLDAVALHKTYKVLFDGRGIIGEPNILERFYYGEFVASELRRCSVERGISLATKFAYILLPPVLDPDSLGETVAVINGMFVMAFDNRPDALEWLGL